MQLKVYEIAWGETVTSTGAIAGDVVTYNITFSDQGVQGPTGATGPAGPSNVLNIGTVTTGAPGSSASATITGTSPSQTLSLAIPRGDVGATGATGPAGPQADINYTVVSGAMTLSNSQNIAADTSGGAFTLTLPANPDAGDAIDIFDYSETFGTSNLTIARNGSRIESLEENLVCNVAGAYFTIIYTGSARGWQIVPRFGTSGGGGETVLTTQGDTLYRGLGVNQRLPIGSPGHILKVNSGGTAPEWGAAPATGVTSVALSSSDLTVSGSPVTSSGTITANLTNSGVSAGTYSKVTVDAKGRVTTGATAAIADVTGLQTALDAKQPSGSYAAAVHTHAISDVTGLQTALDGKQASGNYATLVNGTVPSDQLPSYVDDVVEYANLAAFPVTGESGKIFVAIDTRKTYRWSGSAYVEISPSEVTSVAGRTGAVTLAVADVSDAVPTSRSISAGTGLTGGGNLTADRTLTVAYGTTSGTACEGNDARLSDSRTPTAHAASHAAGTKAQFSGVIAGTGENYLIQADNIGTAGNSITLSFNGTDEISTVLAAWNSANPSNQATVIAGDNSLLPNNGTSITLSGGTAAGSDPAFDQNLNTSNSPTFNKLTLTPDLNNSSLKLGTLEFQGYALNNAWIGDNVYFDGANFKRRNTGAATLFYFAGAEGQFRCGTSDSAGTSVTINPVIKFGAGGTFAIGPELSNVGGFEDGMLYSDGNNIGFSDKTDIDKKATLDLSGITSGETRSLEIPDASGTLALTSDIPANTIASTIVDAKGDLIVATAADTVARLPVGATNGHVLTVDSAEAGGMKWAAASGGGVSSVSSSASDVLGVSGANITGVDANADRIIFWDDSASALKHLTVGSGLSLTDTTLTATASGTIGGSTGATDNSVLRSDGTGGSTAQSSAITIGDEIRTFSITGDATADTITATGSGFANGQRVRITALTGGSGLSTGNYFVINASGDTFQVSTTEGGAASLFTTNITAGTLINGHFFQQHTQISNTGANTDIPLVLTPKGTGAFIVGLPPDGTTTGGNSRGAYAIDISTGAPRVAADRVGSGTNSVSIGRQANAQSESSIAVGYGAACSSAAYSVAIGLNAATAANDAIGIGQNTAARSTNSIAIGNASGVNFNFSNAIAIGASSVGGATSAIAIGASTSVTGVNAVGLNLGTSLRSAFACRPLQAVFWGGQTTTNAATILDLDVTATNRFTIAASTALAVDILLVARRTDVADKWLVARRFLGIRRDGSNNTSLIGAVQTLGTDQSEGSPSWTFALTADDTNEALQLEVTGATGETINWRATAIYRVVG